MYIQIQVIILIREFERIELPNVRLSTSPAASNAEERATSNIITSDLLIIFSLNTFTAMFDIRIFRGPNVTEQKKTLKSLSCNRNYF